MTEEPGGLQSSGSKKRTNSATKQQQREGVFLSHSQIQYATIGHSKLLTCIDCVYWWFSSKEPACNAGDPGSIPRSGRSPREGNGNPLPYSCLENSTDIGASWATIHGVTKSQTERLTLSLSKEGLVMWVNYLQTLLPFL